MKHTLRLTSCLLALTSLSAFAEKSILVGGEKMFASKNIIGNAVNSKEHTTLVAAVKAAELVKTLQGDGPFTVFAPTDAAFSKLPAGTVETLVKPENKAMLTKILTYHVVAGKMSFSDLAKKIIADDGKAMLTTVLGEKITLMMNGDHNIIIKDAKGNLANISTYDVNQSNGVIHVVDSVLMP